MLRYFPYNSHPSVVHLYDSFKSTHHFLVSVANGFSVYLPLSFFVNFQVRKAIYESVKISNRLTKKTVMKNAEAISGRTFAENTVKNVLRVRTNLFVQMF